MIRVALPAHLRTLARVSGPIEVEVPPPATQQSLIDAIESAYPALRGTIRDPATRRRRPFVRFFVGEEDLSHEPPDAALPDSVVRGEEPFYVIGAMAGG